MNKAVMKLAVIATAISLVLTGCESAKPGRAKKAATPVITTSDEFAITENFHPNIQATKPTKDCEWWVMYDIPKGKPGTAVILNHVQTRWKTSVDLNKEYTFSYKNPVKKGSVNRTSRGTSFITKGCGSWFRK